MVMTVGEGTLSVVRTKIRRLVTFLNPPVRMTKEFWYISTKHAVGLTKNNNVPTPDIKQEKEYIPFVYSTKPWYIYINRENDSDIISIFLINKTSDEIVPCGLI